MNWDYVFESVCVFYLCLFTGSIAYFIGMASIETRRDKSRRSTQLAGMVAIVFISMLAGSYERFIIGCLVLIPPFIIGTRDGNQSEKELQEKKLKASRSIFTDNLDM